MKYKFPLNKIKQLYEINLKEKGPKPTAVGWNSQESQNLRFEMLASVIKNRSQLISINDYGCGYGSLLEFLTKKAKIKVGKYYGYDVSKKMISSAKSKLKWFPGKACFICSPHIKTIADYTFVSGTFNVKFKVNNDKWRNFVTKKLDEINQFSRLGFAFNLLTTYVDWKDKNLFYGNPCFWFDLCKKKYSKKVSLIHEYPLFEWTIYVNR